MRAHLVGGSLGGALLREGLRRSRALGHGAVMLVGDAPYYERFGFSRTCARALWLPGPYDPGRFLGLELRPGALEGACGLISATGAIEPKPDLSTLVAAASGSVLGIQPRA